MHAASSGRLQIITSNFFHFHSTHAQTEMERKFQGELKAREIQAREDLRLSDGWRKCLKLLGMLSIATPDVFLDSN